MTSPNRTTNDANGLLTCNGSIMSLETVGNGKSLTHTMSDKGGAYHVSDSHSQNVGGATTRRISAVRKTLAGWLRLDRSVSTCNTTTNHKTAQRSRSIENFRLFSGRPASPQAGQPVIETEVRGRTGERRFVWGNWRRRLTSRSVVPNHHDSSTSETQKPNPASPQNPAVAKRALPPVPSPIPPNPDVGNFEQAEHVPADSPEPQFDELHGIAAYLEDRQGDEEEEDDGAFSVHHSGKNGGAGLIDFAASLEKVKSVCTFVHTINLLKTV